jgi:hypothetical protein
VSKNGVICEDIMGYSSAKPGSLEDTIGYVYIYNYIIDTVVNQPYDV